MWNAIESFFEIKIYNIGLRTGRERFMDETLKNPIVELTNAWDETQTEMKKEKQKQNCYGYIDDLLPDWKTGIIRCI